MQIGVSVLCPLSFMPAFSLSQLLLTLLAYLFPCSNSSGNGQRNLTFDLPMISQSSPLNLLFSQHTALKGVSHTEKQTKQAAKQMEKLQNFQESNQTHLTR